MVKSYLKLKTVLVSSLISGIMLISTVSSFAGSAVGSYSYYSCYGKNYHNFNAIDTGSNYASASTIASTDSGTVPSGYLGCLPQVCDPSGQIILQGNWIFSANETYALQASATKTNCKLGENYCSYGATAAYNGNGYYNYGTFKSPNQTIMK